MKLQVGKSYSKPTSGLIITVLELQRIGDEKYEILAILSAKEGGEMYETEYYTVYKDFTDVWVEYEG